MWQAYYYNKNEFIYIANRVFYYPLEIIDKIHKIKKTDDWDHTFETRVSNK